MSLEHFGEFNVTGDMQLARGMLLLDDCEGTLLWTISGTGADFAGTFETGAAFHGTKGLQLVTRVTDPADNDVCKALRYLAYPAAKLVVGRVLIGVPDVSVVRYIEFDLHTFDGSKEYQASVIWRPNTPRMEFKNSAGNNETLAGYGQAFPDGAWTTFAFGFEVDTMKYLFAELNGIRKDLSAEGIYEVGASSDRCVTMSITLVTIGAALATAYFDSIYCGQYLNI